MSLLKRMSGIKALLMLTVLLSVATGIVRCAGLVVTMPYNDFNVAEAGITTHYLDKNYTTPWRCKISWALTWNSSNVDTGYPQTTILLGNESTLSTSSNVFVVVTNDTTVEASYFDGTDTYKFFSAKILENDEELDVWFVEGTDTNLVFKDKAGKTIGGYVYADGDLEAFNLVYTGAKGNGDLDNTTVTAGTVKLEPMKGTGVTDISFATDLMMAIVPLIVIIGIVGYISKLGKSM